MRMDEESGVASTPMQVYLCHDCGGWHVGHVPYFRVWQILFELFKKVKEDTHEAI